MSTNNLVSVIIIFLDEEKFIEEAIKSVFDQSHTNWELILVDDGSSDHSVEIAECYAKYYPEKIKYMEHPGHQNLGMSASRNLGILHSNGQFVTFLDADDVWLPDKLAQQIEILNSNADAAMVYGRTLIWHSWDENSNNIEIESDYFYELGVKPDNLINPPDLFLLLLHNKVQTPTTCNVMIRREVFDKVGLFENNFRSMYEDQVYFSKILLKLPVYVSSHLWAKYRQHSESCNSISGQGADYLSMRLPFLKWLLSYLAMQGYDKKSYVWKALQKEFWMCTHPNANYLISKYTHYKNRIKFLLGTKLSKRADT